MPNFALLVSAGVAVAAAFVMAAAFYIRAVNAISHLARGKKSEWEDSGLIDLFGLKKLDLTDESYPTLLRRARIGFLVCLFLLMACILGLGWFTQGTAH